MKRFLIILCGIAVTIGIIAAVAGGLITGFFFQDTKAPLKAPNAEVTVPRFHQVDLPFEHRHDSDQSLPFAAGAWIDVDQSGTPELFLGGGRGQADGLFSYANGSFRPHPLSATLTKDTTDATYSAVSIDADHDGDIDLFVTRDSGLVLHENLGDSFTSTPIQIPLNTKTLALSLAPTDLNQDGWVDFFVAGYIRPEEVAGLTIFTDPDYGGSSLLLLNRANNTFDDVTASAGLDYVHNTFQAVWLDLDDDFDQDLVVAYDTGQVRTWRNRGDLTFENVPNPSSDVFAYPMGIAVGDWDNDLRVDLFFTNTGSSIPLLVARGDLKDDQTLNEQWMLWRNVGNFVFEDLTVDAGLKNYEFAWGAVLEDFNLDGLLDLVVSENFVDFPPHKVFPLPGRFMLQNSDHVFAPAGKDAEVDNPYFGITPLAADVNGDGLLDLVHVNIDGPSRAFIQQLTPGLGAYLQIDLPDTVASLGAKVSVVTEKGAQVRYLVASEGLCSDQSSTLFFGLGAAREILSVTVGYADGHRLELGPSAVNLTLSVPSRT